MHSIPENCSKDLYHKRYSAENYKEFCKDFEIGHSFASRKVLSFEIYKVVRT